MNYAYQEIVSTIEKGGNCLDCSSNEGHWYEKLSQETNLSKSQYYGIDWNENSVLSGRKKGLNLQKARAEKRSASIESLPGFDFKLTIMFPTWETNTTRYKMMET